MSAKRGTNKTKLKKPTIKTDRGNDFSPLIRFTKIPDSKEEIEKQIVAIQRTILQGGWYIGKRLLALHTKYMKDMSKGEFGEYCEKQFGIAIQTAYKLMYVANNFDVVSAQRQGSKLYLLQPLKEELRIEALDYLKKKDPTYRQFQDWIRMQFVPQLLEAPSVQAKPGFTFRGNTMSVNFTTLGRKIKEDKYDQMMQDIMKVISKYSEEAIEEK